MADQCVKVCGAIVPWLFVQGYTNPITATHAELEQADQAAVRTFLTGRHIYVVVLASAGVRAA